MFDSTNMNVEIIFGEVTLLGLARNVIDRKAISRFILNSRLHYNVVAGMRSYNYCNTSRQAGWAKGARRGSCIYLGVVLPAHTDALTRREP